MAQSSMFARLGAQVANGNMKTMRETPRNFVEQDTFEVTLDQIRGNAKGRTLVTDKGTFTSHLLLVTVHDFPVEGEKGKVTKQDVQFQTSVLKSQLSGGWKVGERKQCVIGIRSEEDALAIAKKAKREPLFSDYVQINSVGVAEEITDESETQGVAFLQQALGRIMAGNANV